jgi:hypothetical protein
MMEEDEIMYRDDKGSPIQEGYIEMREMHEIDTLTIQETDKACLFGK